MSPSQDGSGVQHAAIQQQISQGLTPLSGPLPTGNVLGTIQTSPGIFNQLGHM